MDEEAEWFRTNAVDPRVAIRFLLDLRSVFEAIAEAPYAHPEVHGDVRRCRVLTFPAYSVFYRVLNGVVVVTAVFHGRRQPAIWRRRR